MKKRFKQFTALCLTMAMIFSMWVPRATFASSTFEISGSITLPNGIKVPQGKTFKIELRTSDAYHEIYEIPSGESQVNYTFTMEETNYAQKFSYTLVDDTGLNIVSSGFYGHPSTIVYDYNEAHSFTSASEKQNINFPLPEGHRVEGYIKRAPNSDLSSPLDISYTFFKEEENIRVHAFSTIEPNLNEVYYTQVLPASGDFYVEYSINDNYGPFDTQLSSYKERIVSTGSTDQNIQLTAGHHVSGVLMLPEIMEPLNADAKYNICFVDENGKQYTAWRNKTNIWDTPMTKGSKSLWYDVVLPSGHYYIQVTNTTNQMNWNTIYHTSQGATKIFDDKTLVSIDADQQIDLVAEIPSGDTVLKPATYPDLIINGHVDIPKGFADNFYLYTYGHYMNHESRIQKRFNTGKSSYGKIPYSGVIPGNLVQTGQSRLIMNIQYSNEGISGYMRDYFIKPSGMELNVENSYINPNTPLVPINNLDFSPIKAISSNLKLTLADITDHERYGTYFVCDENGNTLIRQHYNPRINANALESEVRRLDIPTSFEKYTLMASIEGYAKTWITENGSSSNFSAAKVFTQNDLPANINIEMKKLETKTISGRIIRPNGMTSGGAISVQITPEKTNSNLAASQSLIIPEGAQGADFSYKLPIDNFDTFSIGIRTTEPNIVSAGYYQPSAEGQLSTDWEDALAIPVQNPNEALDIGTLELIEADTLNMSLSNSKNIPVKWLQVLAIDENQKCVGTFFTNEAHFPLEVPLNYKKGTSKIKILVMVHDGQAHQTEYFHYIDGSYALASGSENGKWFTLQDTLNSPVDLVARDISTPSIPVTGITLNKTSETLEKTDVGFVLNATLSPADASNKAIQWTSSMPNVATVNSNGSVKPVSAGTTIITVRSIQNPEIFASCTVTVLESNLEILPTNIAIQVPHGLSVGDTFHSSAEILPVNASNKTVTWSSSDQSKASIDSSGTITALSRGFVNITGTTHNGHSHTLPLVIKNKIKSLSAIKINGSPIDSFSPVQTTYDIGDYTEGQVISLSATPTDAYASVKILGKNGDQNILLKLGVNSIPILVTAEDDSTNVYTLNLNVPVPVGQPVTIDDSTNKVIKVPETMKPEDTLSLKINKSVKDAKLDLGKPQSTEGKREITLAGSLNLEVTHVSNGSVGISIPSGVKVSSVDNWDGQIMLPAVTESSNETAVEIGVPNMELTFDKPVRIVIPGKAGKIAKWTRGNQTHTITHNLSNDSLSQAQAELKNGIREAKMNVGDDLVIWTTHFTTFTALSDNAHIPPIVPVIPSTPVSGATSTTPVVPTEKPANKTYVYSGKDESTLIPLEGGIQIKIPSNVMKAIEELQVEKENIPSKFNDVILSKNDSMVVPVTRFKFMNQKTLKEVESFDGYVELQFELPNEFSDSKAHLQGIAFNALGEVRPLPTLIKEENGKKWISLYTLSTSSVAVIQNSVSVASTNDHWSKNTINKMASSMIISKNLLNPQSKITRGKFSLIVAKALGIEGVVPDSEFKDIIENTEENRAITALYRAGIVLGANGSFNPSETLTREQAAIMLSNIEKLAPYQTQATKKITGYKDTNTISKWAKSAFNLMVSKSILNGYADQTLRPKEMLTEEVALVMVYNALKSAKLIQ